MSIDGLDQADWQQLGDIVGQCDGLLSPVFSGAMLSPSTVAGIVERVAVFHRHGILLTVSGEISNRKAGERWATEMSRRGLLRVTRWQQRRYVKPTAGLDAMIRAEVENATLDEIRDFVNRLATPREGAYVNAGHVWEGSMVDIQPTDERFDQAVCGLRWRYLPAAVRGWATCMSDTLARMGFAITQAGRRADLASLSPSVSIPGKFAKTAGHAYFDGLDEMTIARREFVGESVFIPLSAGRWKRLPPSTTSPSNIATKPTSRPARRRQPK